MAITATKLTVSGGATAMNAGFRKPRAKRISDPGRKSSAKHAATIGTVENQLI
ncbi:hypothetical protein [Pseudarthrobacter raffinosi]|uniref:hypothetical protein n=1 Tax=Pseudarthrobacter raffinosi TaxID=2953651 RepID=UPI00208EB4CD|nr:hypothetical protein [Pseudarthrobacter sp. MDT3-28]MCO4237903.1 hypothetical protein [Pseudarthrobacter sp. MDT3-28]